MQKLHLYLLFLLGVGPILCVLPEDDNSCLSQCFHQPKEACPPRENPCHCRQLSNCKGAAICCDVTDFTLLEGIGCGNLTIHTKALHIRNATFDVLDLSDKQFASVWTGLQYLSITDGKIGNIIGQFSKHTQINCLNLSSNSLRGVGKRKDRILANLFSLNYLDLSNNNLTEIPSFKKDGNITLNISNNKNITCTLLKPLLIKRAEEVTFAKENDTFCHHVENYNKDSWVVPTDTILPFRQYRRVVEIQLPENCYSNCTCSVSRFVTELQNIPYFEVAVDCSAKNFWALPVPLPENTITLNISNNNVSSLEEVNHPSYHMVRYFDASYNQITSMQPLEGTKLFSNFGHLSLAHNKIKIFEQYLLDNLEFDRTTAVKELLLGSNKITCDCNTLKFKNWLIVHLRYIADSHTITCENINNMRVLDLDSTKICQSPPDWTDYIYYIITGEVLLLVLLIVKVTYDYWIFKTAGYLPWPANKMPRLPCDWLCE